MQTKFQLFSVLGKVFGYAVTEHAFRDAYTIRDTCPQEGTTHFSGHIHVYINQNDLLVNENITCRVARLKKVWKQEIV